MLHSDFGQESGPIPHLHCLDLDILRSPFPSPAAGSALPCDYVLSWAKEVHLGFGHPLMMSSWCLAFAFEWWKQWPWLVCVGTGSFPEDAQNADYRVGALDLKPVALNGLFLG